MFFIDDTRLFTIESTSYGDVYCYGVVGKDHILKFTKKSKSYFRFTCNKALKEVKSGKCISGIPSNNKNRQLVLTKECDKTWTYSPTKKHLVYDEYGNCLSPWNYDWVKLPGVRVTPGLSTCRNWNEISLNGKFLISSFSNTWDEAERNSIGWGIRRHIHLFLIGIWYCTVLHWLTWNSKQIFNQLVLPML